MGSLVLLRRWGPAVAVMAAIFVASSIPGDDLPDVGSVNLMLRKAGHVCGYLLLGFTYLRGLVPSGRPGAKSAILGVLLAALYGVSDEFHQSFIPGRGPAATDVLIDAAGAALGVGLRLLLEARRVAGPSAEPL